MICRLHEGKTKLKEEVVALTELTLNCRDRVRVLVQVLLEFISQQEYDKAGTMVKLSTPLPTGSLLPPYL